MVIYFKICNVVLVNINNEVLKENWCYLNVWCIIVYLYLLI